MDRFLAAAVQLTSIADKRRNLATALELVAEAARRGARFVALPENVDYIGAETDKLALAEPLDGPTFTAFASAAKAHGIHLLAGTLAEATGDPKRARNTSVLYGPDGSRLAVYRKIHLFDVAIPDGGTYRESDVVEAGTEVVDAATPLARFGLSICYDLRFPELYRALAARGAEVLLVPSAFTLYTGKDHWEILLRSRAVENTCWVVAPAQSGRHSERRVTYGNSMIVDPWGTVVARASDGPGVIVAEISGGALDRVRRELPSLRHRRLGLDVPGGHAGR